jgi:hypothetical protein
MADEVLKLLIKRVPVSRNATLSGYARHKVKGQVFPAIVPAAPQDRVQGKVGGCRTQAVDAGLASYLYSWPAATTAHSHLRTSTVAKY